MKVSSKVGVLVLITCSFVTLALEYWGTSFFFGPANAYTREADTFDAPVYHGRAHYCSGALAPTPYSLQLANDDIKLVVLGSPKGGATLSTQIMFRKLGITQEARDLNPWIHVYRNKKYNPSNPSRDCRQVCPQADWTCIKFLRSPFDRVVSSYIHVMRTELPLPQLDDILDGRKRRIDASFADFVHALQRRVERNDPSPQDEHFTPQSTTDGCDDLAFLLPIESVEEGLDTLYQLTDVRLNATGLTRAHYVEKGETKGDRNVVWEPFVNLKTAGATRGDGKVMMPSYSAYFVDDDINAQFCRLFCQDLMLFAKACDQPFLKNLPQTRQACSSERHRVLNICGPDYDFFGSSLHGGNAETVDHLPHLVLHIGPHKTGTTSIQHGLQDCSGFAKEKLGITVVPGEFPRGWQHNYALHVQQEATTSDYTRRVNGPGGQFYKSLYDEGLYARTVEKIRSCRSRKACNMILSSEVLSEYGENDWTHLLQKFPGWRISVVVFHRSFASVLSSSYVEINKRYQQRSAPVPYLEFVKHSLNSTRHPLDLEKVVGTAIGNSCGTKRGPHECRIVRTSYEDFLQSAESPVEFLMLNVTLGSLSSGGKLRNLLRSGRECTPRPQVNTSPKNGVVIAQLLRHVASEMISQANCQNRTFDLYVDDQSVLDIVGDVIFPQSCLISKQIQRNNISPYYTSSSEDISAAASKICTIIPENFTLEHQAIVDKLVGMGCGWNNDPSTRYHVR